MNVAAISAEANYLLTFIVLTWLDRHAESQRPFWNLFVAFSAATVVQIILR